MLSLFGCRKTRLVSLYVRNAGESNGGLRVLLFRLMVSGSKRFSSVEAVERCDELKRERRENSFAIAYLTKSCGLSEGSAKSISRSIQFNSSEKPDSVLELLKKHGFTGHQIARVVKSCPQILTAGVDGVLLPKLEFISTIGFSGAERAKLITRCPKILCRSLHNTIIPSYDALKSILTPDEIVLCLKHSSWLLSVHVQKYLAAKVSILNRHGAPQGQIRKLVKFASHVVMRANDKFDGSVKKVIGMGFDPTKSNFIEAVAVICQLQESTWEQKIKVYKSLGWSDDEILLAFRMSPRCMGYSVKKIRIAMDFYLYKMDVQPSLIAKTPNILGYSLEKRIKPRCSVIAVLISKGVLKNGNFSYAYILRIGDKQFMDRFVIKYWEDVTELLSVSKGKSVSQILGSSCKLA